MGKKLTTGEFIIKSKKIHGSKYDYSMSNYVNNYSKIKIICSVHGEFEQIAAGHMNGAGCFKCNHKFRHLDINILLKRMNDIHKNKYTYPNLEYKNTKNKIKIICPTHGLFEQIISIHYSGSGCPKCVGQNRTTDEFINQSKIIHGNRYDYSLVDYKSYKLLIEILCPVHGSFKQIPRKHLIGHGCPICKESKGEREIRNYLNCNNINFVSQKRFNDCKNQRALPFDFYLPEHNLCIEYNGHQHYMPIKIWGNSKAYKLQQKKDIIKSDYCKKNNIKLLVIPYYMDIIGELKKGLK